MKTSLSGKKFTAQEPSIMVPKYICIPAKLRIDYQSTKTSWIWAAEDKREQVMFYSVSVSCSSLPEDNNDEAPVQESLPGGLEVHTYCTGGPSGHTRHLSPTCPPVLSTITLHPSVTTQEVGPSRLENPLWDPHVTP